MAWFLLSFALGECHLLGRRLIWCGLAQRSKRRCGKTCLLGMRHRSTAHIGASPIQKRDLLGGNQSAKGG